MLWCLGSNPEKVMGVSSPSGLSSALAKSAALHFTHRQPCAQLAVLFHANEIVFTNWFLLELLNFSLKWTTFSEKINIIISSMNRSWGIYIIWIIIITLWKRFHFYLILFYQNHWIIHFTDRFPSLGERKRNISIILRDLVVSEKFDYVSIYFFSVNKSVAQK